MWIDFFLKQIGLYWKTMNSKFCFKLQLLVLANPNSTTFNVKLTTSSRKSGLIPITFNVLAPNLMYCRKIIKALKLYHGLTIR